MFRGKTRRIAGIALLSIVALSAFGFAAANTVPASQAGDGNGAVSGYTISNVHYTLNAANPRNIDKVTFKLNVAPIAGSTMEVKLVAAGTVWYACTNVTVTLTCDTTVGTQATVLGSDDLRVVVAD